MNRLQVRRFALAVMALAPGVAAAQIVDPAEASLDPARALADLELAVGVRAVTSVNGNIDRSGDTSNLLDFSDTYVYLRPRVALFRRTWRAGALFALTLPDAYVQPGTVFLAEANLFIESRWLTFRVGRARLKTRAVPIPTLRDDDLIRFTDAENPFSDGRSTADQQFGNTLDMSLWPTPRLYLDAHLENLPTYVLAPEDGAAFRLNSVGMTIGYREIPALASLSILRQAAVGFNAYNVDTDTQGWAFEGIAGLWINVIADPIHAVDLRAQVLYEGGVDGASSPDTPQGALRSRSVATVASLGYTNRSNRLLPTYRFAAIAGARRHLDAGKNELSFVANGFYSLGVGVDVGVQYQVQRTDDGVSLLFGSEQEHSFRLAFVGTFETIFNPRFDERDSLLNTESGYLP